MTAYGLTKDDYIKILEFYNIKVPSNYSKLKEMADDILCNKLCTRITSPTQRPTKFARTRSRNRSIKNTASLY